MRYENRESLLSRLSIQLIKKTLHVLSENTPVFTEGGSKASRSREQNFLSLAELIWPEQCTVLILLITRNPTYPRIN